MKYIKRNGKVTWREPSLDVSLINTESIFREFSPAVINGDGTTYCRIKGEKGHWTVLYPDEKIQPSFQSNVG